MTFYDQKRRNSGIKDAIANHFKSSLHDSLPSISNKSNKETKKESLVEVLTPNNNNIKNVEL